MAKRYCNCGRKIVVFKCRGYKGVKQGKDDHDLCQRCWQSFRNSGKIRLIPPVASVTN